MYSKLYHYEVDEEVLKRYMTYTSERYKEIIRMQIYLADNNIPFEYSDKLSLAELQYIFGILNEYLNEKNREIDRQISETRQ